MADKFIIKDGELIAYFNYSKKSEVIIPKNVKVISSKCKIVYDNPVKIIIPKSVKVIRDNAFSLFNVSEIVFEENSQLEEIGASFVKGKFEKLVVPNSVKYIHEKAFAEIVCEDVKLPEKFEYVKQLKNNFNHMTESNNKSIKKVDFAEKQKKKAEKNAKKYANSKYKDWSQSDLRFKYISEEINNKGFVIDNFVSLIVGAIIVGLLMLGVCWVFTLLGSLMEEFPRLWFWLPGIGAFGMISYGMFGIIHRKSQNEILYFVEDKISLQKEARAAVKSAIAAEKELAEAARSYYNSSSSSSSSSSDSSSSSSSSPSSYDTYDSSGRKSGSVENKGSGRINNVYDNNGNVVGWANDNGGDMMDVHYNDGSRGTIDKK